MANKYSFSNFNENMAKAQGISLPISTKFGIEICNSIKGKNLQKVKDLLNEVIKKKRVIKFTRFTGDLGHKKKKMGPGRFPIKAATHILKLIEQAEANAQFKGLNTSDLIIKHINCNIDSRPWRSGRRRRIKMKRTNVEVVVEEIKGKKEMKKEEKVKEIKKQKEVKKETKVKESVKTGGEVKTKIKENKKEETKK